MTDDAERWKEKYLKTIEQHDKIERRWDARLDLLRRGLVRSTLAAEGSDKAVDLCMKEMREVIRSDNMDAGLAGLIPRLEKAVLDSEHRRETRMNQVREALTSLVEQLQSLPLPAEHTRALKKLGKKIDGGVGQSRDLPPLLGELSGLQERALAALKKAPDDARPGLLQRLFGARESAEALAESTAPVQPQPAPEPATEAEAAPVAPSASPSVAPLPPAQPEPTPAPVAAAVVEAASESSTQTPQQPPQAPAPAVDAPTPALQAADEAAVPAAHSAEATAADEQRILEPAAPAAAPLPALADTCAAEDGPYALPQALEPPYSQVAAHIEQTLLGLLDDLNLPEHYKDQALAMRERVARGLNWYELIPILDDLAVFMLAITDSGQHEFEAYLQQLNERLEAFHGHLQDASAGHADNSVAAQQLDSQLREQVGGLQSSVKGASDLASLKQVLDSRFEGLLGTLDAHQHARDQREQELAARLHGLAARVAGMEQEALGYREHLEEQRQKALLDPLTGLPNRAAWAERIEQEVQAWHNQGGQLSMAIIDLDHFKRINDGYGHLAGDKVLKIVANVLSKRLRARDFIARFGGEEFVLLMPQTPLCAAAQFAESLRAAVEACPFHFKGEPVTITLCIGVSTFNPAERSDTVLKRADQALYRAKAQGRNRVEQG
ncbi:GGDEF domain-containing protein [Pseudomonas cremoricolorata]|uniref:diguanylate cyclase n=1 Tax=Pseudomonas cremoricolorata TaxID=157783 RepID=A0A089WR36_9PSED|nr:GGDEF domain-containing protein [Pseudomonas cremoricolorata]AIR88962.1 DeoR faimly transcriptional regulator [Pseudomonas cremoricolorata]